MSIIQGTGRGGARSLYDYPIEQSLRFNGSSYLSRTPTITGDRKVFTFSFWAKKSINSQYQILFDVETGTLDFKYQFSNNDQLYFYSPNSAGTGWAGIKYTTAIFRDTSAWYHIVISLNKNTGTPSCYVNGKAEVLLDNPSYTTWTGDSNVNLQNISHRIGRSNGSTAYNFEGYLANVQFIDGQALDASYFGETKDDIWIPKTFDGTSSTGGSTVSTDYGTNGFLLDFSSISGTTINDTAPIDTNHSSANNWTATGF